MEQLMVRNVTGPSEPQSDAELQIGGQLSVPSSSLFPFPIREALSSLRTDGAEKWPLTESRQALKHLP